MRAPLTLSLALPLIALGCSDSAVSEGSSSGSGAGSGGAAVEVVDLGEGLTIQVFEEGSGPVVEEGVHVDIHFELFLKDGEKLIQSTYDMGAPYHHEPGIGDAIPAVQRALVGLREGSRVRLDIPSHLAYGATGFEELVPPYADLLMDMFIVKVFGPNEPH